MNAQPKKLQEENWRLTYRLDEKLQADYGSEELFVIDCRMATIKENLAATSKDFEAVIRSKDRQLLKAQQDLTRISTYTETVRQEIRAKTREHLAVVQEALGILETNNIPTGKGECHAPLQ